MFVRVEVRQSDIFGKGCFAAEPIRRGTIVCCFTAGARIITEAEYLAACEREDLPLMRTGTRYAGKYFSVGNEDEPYTYVNHRFEPNMLCHCGVVIATADIAVGEELTLDYRTLIDHTDIGIYADAATGQEIRGLRARETMLRTAREMIALVESIDGWQG